MKTNFTIIYNRFHNEYQVWADTKCNGEIVKRFKTAAAAERWVEKHSY